MSASLRSMLKDNKVRLVHLYLRLFLSRGDKSFLMKCDELLGDVLSDDGGDSDQCLCVSETMKPPSARAGGIDFF